MTIQELARKAGVTTRTIRYYTEQGLLPPPKKGRPAEYGEEYVELLELIKGLKAQYLPLEEIRETIGALSSNEVKSLIHKYTPEAPINTARGSASDYIASVLERGNTRSVLKASGPQHYEPVAPASAPQPVAPVPRNTPSGAPGARDAVRQMPLPGHQAAEEIWHRITLAPGIELHYLDTPGSRNRRILAKVLNAVRHILDTT